MQGTAEKIAPLTGLRFFAASAIVIAHCTGLFYPKQIFGSFNLGGAVPLFFVLSGFILTINGMRGRTWGDFMVTRYARIWPAHFAAILLLILVYWPWSLAYFETAFSVVSLVLNVGLVQMLVPVREIYAGYNSVAWSLSAEMAYYAAFPVLFACAARRPALSSATMLVAVIALVLFLPMAFPTMDIGWLQLFNGFWSFTLGVVAGILFLRQGSERMSSRWKNAGTPVELFALAAVIAANGWLGGVQIKDLPGLHTFITFHGASITYVALIFVLAHSRGALSRILSLRPIVYLGEVSFCLYLVHQIVIRWYADHQQLFAGWHHWTKFLFVVLGSLAVAMSFYHLIEVPARRAIVGAWRQRRTERRTSELHPTIKLER
jgi:peptidoglycan/LPS O-acetylase OafA/YrhL